MRRAYRSLSQIFRMSRGGQSVTASGRKQLEGCTIVFAGARQDIGREMRSRRLLVPVQRLEIVAHELLVETRRTDPGLVGFHRPEAGRVGSQGLVDQEKISRLVGTEFELGVGDDDVPRQRVLCREN